MGIAEKIRESIEHRRAEPVVSQPKRSQQQPPADLITDTVLFACVASADYLADAVARLQVEDWPLDWQRRVWVNLVRLAKQRKPANVVTLDPLLDDYEYDLLLRACAATANPYLADYVGVMARLGNAERETAAALQEVCAVGDWGDTREGI